MFSLWIKFATCGRDNSTLLIFKIVPKWTLNTNSFLESRASWINSGCYIFDANSCRIRTISWVAFITNLSSNIKPFADRWNHFTNISLIKVISKRAFNANFIGKQATSWIWNCRCRINANIVRIEDISWITGEAYLVFSVIISAQWWNLLANSILVKIVPERAFCAFSIFEFGTSEIRWSFCLTDHTISVLIQGISWITCLT